MKLDIVSVIHVLQCGCLGDCEIPFCIIAVLCTEFDHKVVNGNRMLLKDCFATYGIHKPEKYSSRALVSVGGGYWYNAKSNVIVPEADDKNLKNVNVYSISFQNIIIPYSGTTRHMKRCFQRKSFMDALSLLAS